MINSNIIETEKIMSVSNLITMIAWILLIVINLILPSKAIEKTKTSVFVSIGSKLSLTVVFIPVLIGLLMLAYPSLSYSDPLAISTNFAFTMSIFPIFGGLACIDAIIDNFDQTLPVKDRHLITK